MSCKIKETMRRTKENIPFSVKVLLDIFLLTGKYAIIMLLILTIIIPTCIVSESMMPTITSGSFGLALYETGESADYGDIVYFFPNIDEEEQVSRISTLFYSITKREVVFVKRVVGLPGDTLEVRDGLLWRNGEPLSEDYVAESTDGSFGPYTVPEGHVFVMGDNRNFSEDSRCFGAVPMGHCFAKQVLLIKAPSL